MPKGHMWQKSSPFKNRNAEELNELFIGKGFMPKPNQEACIVGKGNYLHPKSLREYHIDPKHMGRYREPSHIDIGRSDKYRGNLGKKRFAYLDE